MRKFKINFKGFLQVREKGQKGERKEERPSREQESKGEN